VPATLASRLPMVIAELRPRVSAAIKSGAEDIAANARTKVPVGYPDNHLRRYSRCQAGRCRIRYIRRRRGDILRPYGRVRH